jgi:hypothetical protein
MKHSRARSIVSASRRQSRNAWRAGFWLLAGMSAEPLAPPVVRLALGVGRVSRLLGLSDRERMARRSQPTLAVPSAACPCRMAR